MSFSETVFLFVLALVIFGPKKLPEIARQLGKYMGEFRRASNEFKAQIEQEISHLDLEDRRKAALANQAATASPPAGTANRSSLTTLPPPAAPVELAAEPAVEPATDSAVNSAPNPESSSTSSATPAAPPASQESHA